MLAYTPELFRDRPRHMQVLAAGVAPAALGAGAGILIGISVGAYWAISLLAAIGAFAAGFEHRDVRGGAARGLIGGTIYGLFLLLAHWAAGTHAKVSLGSFPPLLIVITAIIGILISAAGARIARAQRQRADQPQVMETHYPASRGEPDLPALPQLEPRPQQHSGGRPRGRVTILEDEEPRAAPPPDATQEEYRWHTYRQHPSGRPDAVEFVDTYKRFGSTPVLRGLRMGLPEGMVSIIIGPSGTGKSVCIKHMVGLLMPDAGDVLVHGESVPRMKDDDLFEMRKRFGLLFQDGALFGSMDIFDNVAFPLRQHTEKSEEEITEIVMRRLNEVGLAQDVWKFPNELSGGMRKRAGFARALVLDPDIVLFDEPDSGLDPVRTALLGRLIVEVHEDMVEEAKEKRKPYLPTFCVVTHDVLTTRRIGDYINVLWKGRVVEAGPSEEMFNSDNQFVRQFLSGEADGPLSME